MHQTNSIAELQHLVRTWRQAGENIALVPTMGNLHAGHINLVKRAQTLANRVIVSIFVNPTQFGPNEDYTNYPRTLTEDTEKLTKNSVDLLFTPECSTIYPPGASTQVSVHDLSEIHCGAARPGHFTGVTTIITKLFNIAQPDLAIFGEKDFQQLTIIRKMVHDLNIPVSIHSVPTLRESDGLAMSSRNSYLNSEDRTLAPILYQTLSEAKRQIEAGKSDFRKMELVYLQQLQQAGFQPEYFSVCRIDNLSIATITDKELVILTAVKLGKTRLIDNILVSLSDS